MNSITKSRTDGLRREHFLSLSLLHGSCLHNIWGRRLGFHLRTFLRPSCGRGYYIMMNSITKSRTDYNRRHFLSFRHVCGRRIAFSLTTFLRRSCGRGIVVMTRRCLTSASFASGLCILGVLLASVHRFLFSRILVLGRHRPNFVLRFKDDKQ